jgi:[ribosomal protein S18]-alanine N-acetyltransferase
MDMEQENTYHVRKMKDCDIPQVLEIDLDAFPTQWPHPTNSSFHHELRNKLAHYVVVYQDHGNSHSPAKNVPVWEKAASYIKYLFEHDRFFGPISPAGKERLAGMAGIWMMVDEAHVVTIGVRKSQRNKGLGEWLLIAIIDMALDLGAKIVTLEVRVSNVTAQKLYEKYGFSIAGTRRKYYSDNGEDAYIMSTEDINSAEYNRRFQQLRTEHRQRWGHSYNTN